MFVVHFYDGLIYKTQTRAEECFGGGAQSYPQKASWDIKTYTEYMHELILL